MLRASCIVLQAPSELSRPWVHGLVPEMFPLCDALPSCSLITTAAAAAAAARHHHRCRHHHPNPPHPTPPHPSPTRPNQHHITGIVIAISFTPLVLVLPKAGMQSECSRNVV